MTAELSPTLRRTVQRPDRLAAAAFEQNEHATPEEAAEYYGADALIIRDLLGLDLDGGF